MQPVSGNQCPDLLTSLMNMSLVMRLPRNKHLCRSSSNVPRLPSPLEMLQNLLVLLTLDKVRNPLHLPHKKTLQRPQVARTCDAFNILTSQFASRHNGVHFFNIWTSQKRSDAEVSCTFWLGNALRTTTACNFHRSNGSAPPAWASLLVDYPEPQIIGKTPWFATFLLFRAPASSFFCLFLFSDLLSSICPYCRKFDF